MSYNYTLRYRTFDQLLADASVDLTNITLENQIEPQQLIKVAKRVNYELGLRIQKTKEIIIEVHHNKAKLPYDFYILNYALLCQSYSVEQIMPQGVHLEQRNLIPPFYAAPENDNNPCVEPVINCGTRTCGCSNDCNCNCNQQPACPTTEVVETCPITSGCTKPRIELNCKGECMEIVQIVNTSNPIRYNNIVPIKLLANPEAIDCNCPNLYSHSTITAWIKDGFLHTNFRSGKVYLSYEGMMEDEEGNLLVPDHDLLNEYYEYALKQRILENLIMNDTPNAVQKLQLVETRIRAARNNALSLVRTPNFKELKDIFIANRKAQYVKYYDMFKSYDWYTYNPKTNY